MIAMGRFVVLALPMLVTLESPKPAQDAKAQVRSAELARFSAQVRRDTAALRSLLSDDLTYVHSNALAETKSHFIETVATGRIVYDSLVPIELDHRIFGNTAVGNGKVRAQVQMNGQTLKVELIITTV